MPESNLSTTATVVDFSAMSNAELRTELAQGLTLTAVTLSRLACIWQELEKRGEDLSDLRIGLAKTLPLIASGRLAAEAVVSFAGRAIVLKAIEGVPLSLQRKLAAGHRVPVYLVGVDESQLMSVPEMPGFVVARVFKDGQLVVPDQQRAAIALRRKNKLRKRPKHLSVEVVSDRTSLRVGSSLIPLASVVSALSNAAGGNVEVTESEDRPAKVIACKVTDEEKDRIEAAAKAHNMTVDAMVRKAVLAMWCL